MRFRKKPDEIDAVQWSGSNWHEVLDFCGHGNVTTDHKDVFITDHEQGGQRRVTQGQWIVRDPHELFLRIVTDEALQRSWEPVPELHAVR